MALSCKQPRMESEVQYFPLHFEEQSRFIPVIIRDEESIPTYFGEVYVGTLKNKYIHIEGEGGELTVRQIRELADSALNGFELNNELYLLSVKNPNEWIYSTYSSDPNILKKIKVNPSTREWINATIRNGTLEEHISNSTVHITAEERTFWNNKLNLQLDSEKELLEFNRN